MQLRLKKSGRGNDENALLRVKQEKEERQNSTKVRDGEFAELTTQPASEHRTGGREGGVIYFLLSLSGCNCDSSPVT